MRRRWPQLKAQEKTMTKALVVKVGFHQLNFFW